MRPSSARSASVAGAVAVSAAFRCRFDYFGERLFHSDLSISVAGERMLVDRNCHKSILHALP